MDKVPLLIFVGAVGAGKTTIVRRLLQLHPTWAYEDVAQLAGYKSSMRVRCATVDGIASEATHQDWPLLPLLRQGMLIDHLPPGLIRPHMIYVNGDGECGIDYAIEQLNRAEVWWRRVGRWLRLPVFTAPPEAAKLLQLYVKADTVITNYPLDPSFSLMDTQLFEILRELDIETPWTDKMKEGLRW